MYKKEVSGTRNVLNHTYSSQKDLTDQTCVSFSQYESTFYRNNMKLCSTELGKSDSEKI